MSFFIKKKKHEHNQMEYKLRASILRPVNRNGSRPKRAETQLTSILGNKN